MKMKCFVLVLVSVYFFPLSLFSQINWVEYDEDTIFERAEQEDKYVMLYFQLEQCGACRLVERNYFSDESVIDYINQNFVSANIDIMSDSGKKIKEKYVVIGGPTFLFYDADKNLIEKFLYVSSLDTFKLYLNRIPDYKKTLAYFKEQYENGNRDPEFLREYCYKLRDANELDSAMINEYLDTQPYDSLALEKNIRFIYEFAYHGHNPYITVKHDAYIFMKENIDFISQYYYSSQVIARLFFLASKDINRIKHEKDTTSMKIILDVFKKYGKRHQTILYKDILGNIKSRLTMPAPYLSSQQVYYEMIGDSIKAKELKNKIDKIRKEPGHGYWKLLNDQAWRYCEKYDDKQHLLQALDWVERSIELNSNPINHDTYAAILYKLGEYSAALRQAELAVELARKNDEDPPQPTMELIDKIKTAMK
jgi:thioredoxin-related protein